MQPQAAAARGLSAAWLALACCGPAAQPAAGPAVDIAPASSASSPAPAPRKVDGRIRQLSVGVYEVEATLFDALVETPSRVAPRAFTEVVHEDDREVGHRLGGVTPGGVLARLGLIDDDLIEIVNGEKTTTPAAIEAARASARRTGQVTVVLRRNGFQKLMIYRLVYY